MTRSTTGAVMLHCDTDIIITHSGTGVVMTHCDTDMSQSNTDSHHDISDTNMARCGTDVVMTHGDTVALMTHSETDAAMTHCVANVVVTLVYECRSQRWFTASLCIGSFKEQAPRCLPVYTIHVQIVTYS